VPAGTHPVYTGIAWVGAIPSKQHW